MPAAQPIEHLPRRLRAVGLHVRQTPLDALDGLHAVEQRLVRLRILHDQLRLAVDCQDQGMPGFAETIEQLHRVALEVTERTNVVGKIEHVSPHQIYIEFDDSMVRVVQSIRAMGCPCNCPCEAPKQTAADRLRIPSLSAPGQCQLALCCVAAGRGVDKLLSIQHTKADARHEGVPILSWLTDCLSDNPVRYLYTFFGQTLTPECVRYLYTHFGHAECTCSPADRSLRGKCRSLQEVARQAVMRR